MKWRAYVVLAYGILLLIGGAIGHLKAHSFASLIMGSASAAAALASGWMMLKQQRIGRLSAIVLAIVLLGFFTYRYSVTGNFMPAGMMAIISAVVIGVLTIGRCPKKAQS